MAPAGRSRATSRGSSPRCRLGLRACGRPAGCRHAGPAVGDARPRGAGAPTPPSCSPVAKTTRNRLPRNWHGYGVSSGLARALVVPTRCPRSATVLPGDASGRGRAVCLLARRSSASCRLNSRLTTGADTHPRLVDGPPAWPAIAWLPEVAHQAASTACHAPPPARLPTRFVHGSGIARYARSRIRHASPFVGKARSSNAAPHASSKRRALAQWHGATSISRGSTELGERATPAAIPVLALLVG